MKYCYSAIRIPYYNSMGICRAKHPGFQFGRRDVFYRQHRELLEQAANIQTCPQSTICTSPKADP